MDDPQLWPTGAPWPVRHQRVGTSARSGVDGQNRRSRSVPGCAGAGLEGRLDHGGDVEEADPAGQEGARPRSRWRRSARSAPCRRRRSAWRARRSAGKRTGSGGSKVSRPTSAEIEARRRRRHPLRPAQGVGDRDAHVGLAELRQHRAVAERDQAVHDRLRMDQDVDPVLGAGRTGGGPRSARAPCSSWSPNRPRSWRPCPSWDARPPRAASPRPWPRASARGTGRPRRSG